MKDNLQTQIQGLHEVSHRLLSLGEDTGYVYADELSRLNHEVRVLIDAVWRRKGKDSVQEAELCLAVLMGYNACMYANPSDRKKRASILERSCRVLEQLPDSLLKCRLLTYCYGEVYDDELAAQAHAIIRHWGGREYTKEEKEVADTLSLLEHTFRLSSDEFHFNISQ